MKKFGFYSVLLTALIFAGCSEKAMDLDNNNAVGSSSQSGLGNSDVNGQNLLQSEISSVNNINVNGQEIQVDNIYFDFNKYDLTSSSKTKITSNVSKLSALTSDNSIKIIGNTDEWGSDEYNYALGLKRANAVKDALVSKGVQVNISLVSLGESNPVCTEKTKECWSKNRRVEHELEK